MINCYLVIVILKLLKIADLITFQYKYYLKQIELPLNLMKIHIFPLFLKISKYINSVDF